jgi:hypothetical protein
MDLRWLAPLNEQGLIDAVAGCGRVLIVDECRRTGSQSEALMALFAERAPEAKVRRIAAEDSFIPLGRAATITLPSRDRSSPPPSIWSNRASAGRRRRRVVEKLAALVVCPGRGSYGKAELGYLKRLHADKAALIEVVDQMRAERGQATISALDGADRFSVATHTRGDIASPLIFTASYADFLDIDRSRFDVAAVTGNSMGWYTALACAGAVTPAAGFSIVDAMGEHSQAGEPGGQVLLSMVDEDWHELTGLRETRRGLVDAIASRPGHAISVSIELGGMIVLAGNDRGLDALLAEVPPTPGREPMRLVNHGPFHSAR